MCIFLYVYESLYPMYFVYMGICIKHFIVQTYLLLLFKTEFLCVILAVLGLCRRGWLQSHRDLPDCVSHAPRIPGLNTFYTIKSNKIQPFS